MCIITGRNEVVAKVIFLHLFVILFTAGGGVSASMHAGIPTPPDQTPPPRTRQTTPPDQTPPPPHPPPPRTRQTTPPPGSRLQHTVYEWPVRILLECILVVR